MKFPVKLSMLSMLFATLLLFSSCSNPAGGEEEHHEEPVGAVFMMDGDEIARYENGDVTGTLSVTEGEQAEISIHFLAEDGDMFQPDEPEFSLQWSVEDESIATISAEPAAQKWTFTLQGVASGNTFATFSLYHDNHADFTTESIPVSVAAQE